MSEIKASVIIPTHNRADKLAETLGFLCLQRFNPGDYEIIVVDDGSTPPVVLEQPGSGPRIRLERTQGIERSAARNRGAEIAAGELLIFVDDDISVDDSFIEAHTRAHIEWENALAVGAMRLPREAETPFARFRQTLELQGVPTQSGLTSSPNFCTAANMSIAARRFRELGGFDPAILSGEDQDFALRHSLDGGKIVFVREASVVHRDEGLDIRSYCRRTEWGSLNLVSFSRRFPELPQNVERHRVNAPINLGREPLHVSLRKMIKSALALRPVLAILFAVAAALERVAPDSLALDRTYRLLLGAHILRGYRAGLQQSAAGNQPVTTLKLGELGDRAG